jgi:hypothetical protein
MKRAAAFVLLLLTACASPEPKAPAAPPPPSTPAAPPKIAPAPPPRSAREPERPRDACGAYELRSLVGKQRSEIPIPVDPSRRRVACTTCAVTQDFREDRLNIFFDAETGVIKSVSCG